MPPNATQQLKENKSLHVDPIHAPTKYAKLERTRRKATASLNINENLKQKINQKASSGLKTQLHQHVPSP